MTGDMWEDPVDVDGEIIYDIGEDIAKKIGELSAQKPYVIKFSRLISTAMSSAMQSMTRSRSPSPPSMTRPKITQAARLKLPASRVRRSSAKHQPGGQLIRTH